MTVLPPGLIDLPDVPPIVEQHVPPWVSAAEPRRSPIRRAVLVTLVVVTIAVGASVARGGSGPAGTPESDTEPVAASIEVGDAAPTASA